MAISFEKLISDVQNYNDGLELPVTIGEGEKATTERIRLGDVRGQIGTTLARYEAALQQEREQRSTLEQTLRALKDATPTAESTDQRGSRTSAGSISEDDLMSDQWSKGLYNKVMSDFRKELKEREEGLANKHNEFADLSKKGVGALAKLVFKLGAGQQFSRLDGWPKDYDADKAWQVAGERGYLDKDGLPDLKRLHHELTEDSRIENRAKALAEKMFEEQRKVESEKNQSRFNKLGMPTGIRAKSKKDEKKYKSLQDYMMSEDALPTDDEIRNAGLLNAIIR